MTASLVVPESMATSVCEFLATESIPLDVVTSGQSALRVEASTTRQQCKTDVLYTGGWIACSQALKIADALDIGAGSMGKLLNLLDIRVRQCQLGCFR
ncbi:MAG TPA: hypothetical protein VMZ31_06375 [Phycisphaerae bacterium]|nr:hypothetical protein [Phycisphaerae bacterium]